MPAFKQADDETKRLLATVQEKHEPALEDAGVEVGVVFTEGLQVHGWPAFARVRIVPQRDRCQGMPDAEVAIDQDRWNLLSADQKIAILHHELHHLQVQTEDNGDVATDDCSRPRLRIRQHDHQFGWFDEIAKVHGAFSIEVQQASQFANAHGQLYLPGLESPPAPIDVIAKLTSPEGVAQVQKAMRRKGHQITLAVATVDGVKLEHDTKEDR